MQPRTNRPNRAAGHLRRFLVTHFFQLAHHLRPATRFDQQRTTHTGASALGPAEKGARAPPLPLGPPAATERGLSLVRRSSSLLIRRSVGFIHQFPAGSEKVPTRRSY